MQRSRRRMIMGVVLLSLSGLAACGGGEETPQVQAVEYRPGVRLKAEVSDGGREGSMRVEQITYSSADGERVPARLTIPTDRKPRGCLVYQGGLGQAKEQFLELREGMAALRLATFTIDPRNGGARGGPDRALDAIKEPESLLAMILSTVADLRVGLDYLERRPECRDNIAFLGTSFGGVVGVHFAAQDPRIKAAVLTSLGPTFKSAMLVGDVLAEQTPGFPVQVPGAATDPARLAHAVRILGPYDPGKWVGRIAPRPVMLINGRFDPGVVPIDALELADAAGDPKTVLYFDGGHDPFAPGPDQQTVTSRVARFLSDALHLPTDF